MSAAPADPRLAALIDAELDPAYRRRVSAVMAWLPPSSDPDSCIVDIGCGRGYFIHYYAALGQRAMLGVELDPVIAARAAAAHADNENVAIVRADAAALPLPTAACSGVILSEVIEHVDDHLAVLREAFRVLRPGGVAAVTVPHARFPWAWDPINRSLDALRLPPLRRGPLAGIWAGHVRLYGIDELRSVVREAGFEIEEERAMLRYCLPFSHNLLYGIGKPLLESGWLPRGLASSIDRHRSTGKKRSGAVGVLRKLLDVGERRNREHEGFEVPSVGLAIKARKRVGSPSVSPA